MDFHLTREQEMVRKMYREFAENEVKDRRSARNLFALHRIFPQFP